MAAEVTAVDVLFYKGTIWTGSSKKYPKVELIMNDNLTFTYSATVCPDEEDLKGKDCLSSGLEKRVTRSGTGWNVLTDQLDEGNKVADVNGEGHFLVSNMPDSPRLLIVNKIDAATGVEGLPELHYGDLVLKIDTSK